MIIQCTICSDLINPSENIFVTKCGHLFHYNCLNTWIDRSKSCPQCRHRVTEKCMFRVFPNATDSKLTGEENVSSLLMKLDDAKLKLSQQERTMNALHDVNARIMTEQKSHVKTLNSLKEKVIMSESLLTILNEKMLYLNNENKQLKRVQEELEIQKQNVKTLQGLQKVLNSTSEEVKYMLEDYQDVHVVAMFATALKKALDESEEQKNQLRNRLQVAKQELTEEKKKCEDCQSKLLQLEEKLVSVTKDYEIIKKKYKASKEKDPSRLDDTWRLDLSKISSPKRKANETSNISLNTLVNKIENADSPYLNLKQSGLPWAALQQPTTSKGASLIQLAEKKFTKASATVVSGSYFNQDKALSIFQNKEPVLTDFNTCDSMSIVTQSKSEMDISYDGLGGHSKFSDEFPKGKVNTLKSKGTIPKVTAKHKLKRPNPAGAQNVGEMLKKLRDQ